MKNLSSILIGCLVGVVLAVSITFNFIQRQASIEDSDAVESLKNDLYELSTAKDSVEAVNFAVYQRLDSAQLKIASLLDSAAADDDIITDLEEALENALDYIDEINSDTLYQKLLELYETGDILEYGFSANGIRKIAKERETRVSLDSINQRQRSQIQKYLDAIDTQQESLQDLMDNSYEKDALIEQLYQDLEDGVIELHTSKANERRIRKTLRLWQTGSIGAGSVLLLLLILL